MKTLGILATTFMLTWGCWQAFSVSANDWDLLSSRQKVEIIFRNARQSEAKESAYLRARIEIENILSRDPFLKRQEKLWIKAKLKELDITPGRSLAMEVGRP